MSGKHIAVVGAVNVDICGTVSDQPILYDSNPGSNVTSFGGVGRNIAENLARLGLEVDMITVLGDDFFSSELVEYSEKAGISFKHSMHVQGARCSTYISMNYNNGDMIIGVSDMEIYNNMSVEFIASKIDFLNSCDFVFIDTNIPQDVIEYIANNCTVPLGVDPVSTKKALKLTNVIGKFEIIKPNMYEAEVLTDIKIDDDTSLDKCAEFFGKKGVKKVFISLSEEGVYYADGVNKGTIPVNKTYKVVNVSGCGDAFASAAIREFLYGKDIKEMAIAGECAACICASSNKTVCEELTVEHIDKLKGAYDL